MFSKAKFQKMKLNKNSINDNLFIQNSSKSPLSVNNHQNSDVKNQNSNKSIPTPFNKNINVVIQNKKTTIPINNDIKTSIVGNENPKPIPVNNLSQNFDKIPIQNTNNQIFFDNKILNQSNISNPINNINSKEIIFSNNNVGDEIEIKDITSQSNSNQTIKKSNSSNTQTPIFNTQMKTPINENLDIPINSPNNSNSKKKKCKGFLDSCLDELERKNFNSNNDIINDKGKLWAKLDIVKNKYHHINCKNDRGGDDQLCENCKKCFKCLKLKVERIREREINLLKFNISKLKETLHLNEEQIMNLKLKLDEMEKNSEFKNLDFLNNFVNLQKNCASRTKEGHRFFNNEGQTNFWLVSRYFVGFNFLFFNFINLILFNFFLMFYNFLIF